MGIRDDGASVEPGPMDQATLNLIREVITTTDDNLSLELPRGRNDIAVLLGVFLQLMRQGALYKHQYDREGFSGAVAVIGLNTNLTERLRRIKVGPQTLSEGLCAQRVRADGKFADLRGTIREPSERTDWLLYLNTSLGWPALPGTEIGVAVIDRASFRNPETLDRALAWCQAHHAGRIIVINTLGDPLPPGLGAGWIRWPWTPRLRTELFREVGDGPPSGPLSTNCLLSLRTRPVGVRDILSTGVVRSAANLPVRHRCRPQDWRPFPAGCRRRCTARQPSRGAVGQRPHSERLGRQPNRAASAPRRSRRT